MHITATSFGKPMRLKNYSHKKNVKNVENVELSITEVLKLCIQNIISKKEKPEFELKELWDQLPIIREKLKIDTNITDQKLKTHLNSICISELVNLQILTRIHRGYYRYNL